MSEWQPKPGERLVVSAAGLEWARALMTRSRQHLESVGDPRLAPLIEEIGEISDRLRGLEHLIVSIHEALEEEER